AFRLLVLRRRSVAPPSHGELRGPRPPSRGFPCLWRSPPGLASGVPSRFVVVRWWPAVVMMGGPVITAPKDPHPWRRRAGSALALLVPQVVADHHDATVPADHLALVADLLDAGLDLHLRSLSGAPLRARPTCGPGDRVARRVSGWTRGDYL